MLSEYKRLICLPEDTGCYTLLLGRQTKKTWLLFCYSLRLTLINNLLRYPGRGLGCWASLLLQDRGRSAHLHPRGQGSISWVWHRSPLWGRWCLDLGVQSMFGGVWVCVQCSCLCLHVGWVLSIPICVHVCVYVCLFVEVYVSGQGLDSTSENISGPNRWGAYFPPPHSLPVSDAPSHWCVGCFWCPGLGARVCTGSLLAAAWRDLGSVSPLPGCGGPLDLGSLGPGLSLLWCSQLPAQPAALSPRIPVASAL